ncbi:beta-ketoacyl-[acyl-carrier-protein] synthase family protein [Streptomyces sp. NPDC056600]|uniref:beta-ketoacyl-[acyl-carrier-protein] synthase family protein n=1 Tax=Streptomyces sp. NPDC056600 TaxID=3345874 RepID=UPI00369955A6
MSSAIAVTGLGIVAPGGVGVKEAWERLLSGVPTAARDPELEGLPVDFSCRIEDEAIAARLGRGLRWRTDRFIQFAVVAAREAVADAALYPEEWDGERVGVVIGVGGSAMAHTDEYTKLMEGRYGAITPSLVARSQPGMAAGEVSIDLGARGPILTTSTNCTSGASGIAMAKLLLDSGACDIVVVGGTESARNAWGSAAFWRMGALSCRGDDPAAASRPFDADRDGFVLSEGAGVLVLEREEHARARRARVYARLAGQGLAGDAHHCVAPEPEGAGAARAMRAAIADAGLSPADIDHVNAHGTSTTLNDLAEHLALRAVFGTPPPVTANKGVFGHAIAGGSAMEAAFSVLSLHQQVVPPTANLDRQDPEIDLDVVAGAPRRVALRSVISNSVGFGGHNAALVFTAP